MAKPEKLFLRALAGEVLPVPPIWLMRQAGRYLPEYRATRAEAGDFLSLCHNSDLATEVTLQPLRRYGFDAAILFSDILILPQLMGQTVGFKQGEGPVLGPIRTMEGLAALNTDPEAIKNKAQAVLETVSRLSREIPPETALIGFAGAPWTVATYMVEGGSSRDFATLKSLMFEGGPFFPALMELLTEATGDYLIAQIDAGAEAIQLFDTWAGVLPERQFALWGIAPIKRIVEKIHQQRPGIPVIGFPKGVGVGYERYVAETGVDGVSLDSTIPLAWAAKALQPHCTVQGNMDPLLLVAGGAEMTATVTAILEGLGSGPFVF
ncbi:MAG: uroporphyrinogen decarboxylase, partial [Rhodospirillaceae bacterium]